MLPSSGMTLCNWAEVMTTYMNFRHRLMSIMFVKTGMMGTLPWNGVNFQSWLHRCYNNINITGPVKLTYKSRGMHTKRHWSIALCEKKRIMKPLQLVLTIVLISLSLTPGMLGAPHRLGNSSMLCHSCDVAGYGLFIYYIILACSNDWLKFLPVNWQDDSL